VSAEPTAADRLTAAQVIGRRWLADGMDAEVDSNALALDFAAALAAAREEGRREADDLRQRVEALAARNAWDDGYEACRRGEQRHNPYRAAVVPAQPADTSSMGGYTIGPHGDVEFSPTEPAQPVTRTTPTEEADHA
jgi:hypothetical protein